MRESGVLMHISSLPSPYGIGTMGREAYHFVDFLADSHQSIWQILPITTVTERDLFSPYKSYSAFAGNPLFIDIDLLIEDGLLSSHPTYEPFFDEEKVNYAAVQEHRKAIFEEAFLNRDKIDQDAFVAFQNRNSYWLNDYTIFMALLERNDFKDCLDWDEHDIDQAIENRASFHAFLQFIFFQQFRLLRTYANQRGLKIFGDLPIYLSLNSSEYYFNRDIFLVDEDGYPKRLAAVPPDSFAPNGQLWGNPLYDWEHLVETKFDWWKKRIQHSFEQFDILRIDHFRAFDEYYSVPYHAVDTSEGVWTKGPGIAFFEEIHRALGPLDIVAEDLGFITESVYTLLEKTGYPGMNVLQFAYQSDATNRYLPHNHKENSIVYTGTHDNSTLIEWLSTAPQHDLTMMNQYLRIDTYSDPNEAMLRAALSSVAFRCIIPIQDWLNMGGESRMNTPGTTADNWGFRIKREYLTGDLFYRILYFTNLYNR